MIIESYLPPLEGRVKKEYLRIIHTMYWDFYNLDCILTAAFLCFPSHVLLYDVSSTELCIIAKSFDICK